MNVNNPERCMPLDLFDPIAVKLQTQHLEGELGTTLMGVDGLWLALVEDADRFESAEADLASRMRMDNTPSGVLVLSRPLAAKIFGPVPPHLLAAGITMHRSKYLDLSKSAYALLHEYLHMMELMDRSLADLDRIALDASVAG
ncbi:hypothetical protein [Massilia sp. S19_KUP03_FR1]|uniref:hypothetical protein n=1 Tax=Massilia sp. S19_KUP03_FR1 TaxID=3025503 RepID=UPI002FCD8B89